MIFLTKNPKSTNKSGGGGKGDFFLQIDKGSKPEKKFLFRGGGGGRGGGLWGLSEILTKNPNLQKQKKSLGGVGEGWDGGGAWGLGRVCECF